MPRTTEPVSCRLELDLEDDPIDVVPLNLAARRAARRRSSRRRRRTAAGCAPDRPRRRPAGRQHRLGDPAHAASRQKVTLVTPGNVFLEKVFEAIPLVDLEVVKVEDGQPVPVPKPGGAPDRTGRRSSSIIATCPRRCRRATCW